MNKNDSTPIIVCMCIIFIILIIIFTNVNKVNIQNSPKFSTLGCEEYSTKIQDKKIDTNRRIIALLTNEHSILLKIFEAYSLQNNLYTFYDSIRKSYNIEYVIIGGTKTKINKLYVGIDYENNTEIGCIWGKEFSDDGKSITRLYRFVDPINMSDIDQIYGKTVNNCLLETFPEFEIYYDILQGYVRYNVEKNGKKMIGHYIRLQKFHINTKERCEKMISMFEKLKFTHVDFNIFRIEMNRVNCSISYIGIQKLNSDKISITIYYMTEKKQISDTYS